MTDHVSKPTLLVVEDEQLIAFDLEDTLSRLGYRVLGPAMTLAEGMNLAETSALDGAVLDANLTETTSLPIAERLAERGIPFLYVSGYGKRTLDDLGFPDGPSMTKPLCSRTFASVLKDLLQPSAPDSRFAVEGSPA